MIVLKIDWNKIDMNLLFRGEKTDYLNLALKDNKEGRDKYGNDGFVTQDVSKEDRAAGVQGPIVGNWRKLGNATSAPPGREGPDDRQARRPPPAPGRQRQAPAPPAQRERQSGPPPRSRHQAPDNDDPPTAPDNDEPYEHDRQF